MDHNEKTTDFLYIVTQNVDFFITIVYVWFLLLIAAYNKYCKKPTDEQSMTFIVSDIEDKFANEKKKARIEKGTFCCFEINTFIFICGFVEENFRMKRLWALQIIYHILVFVFVFWFGLSSNTSFLFFFFVSFDFFSASCVLVAIILIYIFGYRGGKKDWVMIILFLLCESVLIFCYWFLSILRENLGALEMVFLSYLLLFVFAVFKSIQLSRLTIPEIYRRYPIIADEAGKKARKKTKRHNNNNNNNNENNDENNNNENTDLDLAISKRDELLSNESKDDMTPALNINNPSLLGDEKSNGAIATSMSVTHRMTPSTIITQNNNK